MLDIFLLIVLLWAIYDGWHDGFVKQLASAVGFLLGLFVAATFYSTLGEYLTVDGSQTNMMTSVVAFFILWIIVPIALGFVAKIVTKALKGMCLGLPNSLLGVGVSVVKYLILLSCVLNVMGGLRILDESKTSTSYLYAPCKDFLGWAFDHASTEASSSTVDSDSLRAQETVGDTVWVDVSHKQKPTHRKKTTSDKPKKH